MPFLYTPPYTPNSVYRPNVFVASRASVNALVWAYVTPYLDTIAQPTFAVPLLNESPTGTYNFRFDLQRLLQDNVAPFPNQKTDVFGGLNLPYSQQSNDTKTEYYVEVTYKYQDPITGLLVDLGVTDTSSTFYAIAATRQNEEIMSFADYVPQAASPNTRKWLTTIPNYTAECGDSENLFLGHIADAAADRYRIRTYESSGVLIDDGSFAADTDANEASINSVGIGIANLATQVYLVGAVTLPNPNVAYYTIDLWNSAVPFITFLPTFRVNVVQQCDDSVRLHFFNLLGAPDAYTFKKLQSKSVVIESTTAQKPLVWNIAGSPHSVTDRGEYKLQTSASVEYSAISNPLTVAEADWLYQLATSTEVYREEGVNWISTVVTVERVPIVDEQNGQLSAVQIRITYRDANKIITQHN